MMSKNRFSGGNEESRDGHGNVVDEATIDMAKAELRVLISRLKDKCLKGESQLEKIRVGITHVEIKREKQ